MTPEDHVNDPEEGRRSDPQLGLCPPCRHVKIVRSQRGSTFYMCRLAGVDERFPKYPPQPVFLCPGHES